MTRHSASSPNFKVRGVEVRRASPREVGPVGSLPAAPGRPGESKADAVRHIIERFGR